MHGRCSWPVHGFYERIAALYHHAQGTPWNYLSLVDSTPARDVKTLSARECERSSSRPVSKRGAWKFTVFAPFVTLGCFTFTRIRRTKLRSKSTQNYRIQLSLLNRL